MAEQSAGFTDHFSSIAASYAHFRPLYPDALFAWIAQNAARRDVCWDCACGNGQASRGLAGYFDHVIATDASAAQIAAAFAHPKIEYRIAAAEKSGLDDRSVDAVTVATALHWLNTDSFYREARRVLKPGGIITVWAYTTFGTADKSVDAELQNFYYNTVGPYWPPQRKDVETGYRDLPFPFEEMKPPALTMHASWTLPELLGYLRSWSAAVRFAAARGFDPVAALEKELAPLWGAPDSRRTITWPVAIRAGRV